MNDTIQTTRFILGFCAQPAKTIPLALAKAANGLTLLHTAIVSSKILDEDKFPTMRLTNTYLPNLSSNVLIEGIPGFGAGGAVANGKFKYTFEALFEINSDQLTDEMVNDLQALFDGIIADMSIAEYANVPPALGGGENVTILGAMPSSEAPSD